MSPGCLRSLLDGPVLLADPSTHQLTAVWGLKSAGSSEAQRGSCAAAPSNYSFGSRRLETRPGLQSRRVMTLVERALIRHFLSEGHDLVNVSGTTLRRHELVSTHQPMRFVPPVMYLDKDR